MIPEVKSEICLGIAGSVLGDPDYILNQKKMFLEKQPEIYKNISYAAFELTDEKSATAMIMGSFLTLLLLYKQQECNELNENVR